MLDLTFSTLDPQISQLEAAISSVVTITEQLSKRNF